MADTDIPAARDAAQGRRSAAREGTSRADDEQHAAAIQAYWRGEGFEITALVVPLGPGMVGYRVAVPDLVNGVPRPGTPRVRRDAA